MSEYRRFYQPGGSYFFTVVTYNRSPILTKSKNLSRLQQSFKHVMNQHSFTIEAMVILPDHLHCIWQLPPGDSDFSTRWRLIKRYFSIMKDKPVNERGEKNIWQRRFWEHFLRDEEDWRRHMDYIHYNPVKHRYVQNLADWPHSSFQKALQEGLYPIGWGMEEPSFINSLKIVTTSICKIPPNLPLPKGGITPLWQRGGVEIFQCLCQFNYETVKISDMNKE